MSSKSASSTSVGHRRKHHSGQNMQNRGETDWQVGKSVLDCNRYMWEKKLAVDVCFEVGATDGTVETISAHKYVLVSRSPVFEAMFHGALSKNLGDPIRITDVEPDAFKEALKFIYFEKADVTSHNVLATLYASKKYLLPDLSDLCKNYLAKHFNLENVCSILDQSIFYDEAELTKKCLHFIAPITKEVFETDAFLGMSQAGLQMLIRCDLLYCESEVMVYDACLKWAQHRCQRDKKECNESNLREVLGDTIYKIRFPTMQDVEFARVVGKSNILTANEKSDIYYFLLTKDCNKGNGGDIKFDTKARVHICNRYPVLGTAQQWWSCNGPTDAFSFQADKDIDIVGLTVYGGKEKASHNVMIEIRDPAERVLSKMNTMSIESDGSTTPIPIYLPQAAAVKAGQTYTVMVTMRGPLTHYGSGGTETLTCSGVNLRFLTSNKSTNGTNTKSGQIPHLVFSMK